MERCVAVVPGVAVLLLAGASVAADGWAHRRPIVLPPLQEPGFVELRLDADVAREASPTLADLRVRDGYGAEVPYMLRRRERPAAEAVRDTTLGDLVTPPEGAVRFTLDTGGGRALHNRVRLRIRDQARNFRVPVRVETSEDGRAWQVVREAGFIYRIEGETKVADTAVSYPPSTARWVRVTIGAERGRPLPLAGAALVLAPAPEREEERVPATIVERDAESMRRSSRLVIDLRARRPVDRVEVDVAERTYHRVMLVEASDDRKAWRWVGSGALSAVHAGAVRERLTSARFAEATARYLRLTIQNLDEPPLTVTGVRAFAVKRALLFEAAPGRAYALEYGHRSASPPRYDVTRFAAAFGRALPEATLGSAQEAPPPPPAEPRAQPLAMWASMAMAALALGSLLWRMARGMRAAD